MGRCVVVHFAFGISKEEDTLHFLDNPRSELLTVLLYSIDKTLVDVNDVQRNVLFNTVILEADSTRIIAFVQCDKFTSNLILCVVHLVQNNYRNFQIFLNHILKL